MERVSARSISGMRAQYDAQVKRLLAQKPFLARIMKRAMREFANMTIDEVQRCIEGDPEISSVAVDAGRTNAEIVGGAGESSIPGEGTVLFDIRTFVAIPGHDGAVRVIVNVEAQKSFRPGYAIVTRGVFYAARLLSAQLGTEFSHGRYDALKKVYSIWICMDAPASVGNAVASYRIGKEDVVGCLADDPRSYDKIEVVVVALNRNVPTDDAFANLMNAVLSPEMTREDKLRMLADTYNMDITSDIAEGVDTMCNLSEGLVELGIERGIERGVERGAEQKSIELIVENRKRGVSYGDIARFMGLTVAEVKELERKALAVA